jgi:peptidoglycan hydrolase-like protein with peptidoglycan-binding domain
MPGLPRDLANPDPWEASLARSHARRRLPSPRDLSEREPWEISLLRSRTRRRAAELQFVPTGSRARRLSLGTLVAIAAAPVASVADANGGASGPPAPRPEPPTTASHRLTLRNGSVGRQVKLLQRALGIPADGVFGPETEAAVRSYQATRDLPVDGIVGPLTSAALAQAPQASMVAREPAVRSQARAVEASVAGTASGRSDASPVVRLQEALHVQVDGAFGPETEAAVRHLQASHGLSVDGVVGPDTWRALGVDEHVTLHPVKPPRAPRRSQKTINSHEARGASAGHGDSARIGQSPDRASNPVSRLQEALHVQVDGAFGPETEAAVRHLQASHGLSVDGVVGPDTWRALGVDEHLTLHPPRPASSHTRAAGDGGGEASSVVARVISAADEIATRPYVYGGGHGSFQSTGYDCSGSVSYALHGGGLLSSPEDSSELESYGQPGPGRHITIYANSEHAWMTIDGRRFDTIAQQETGTRWSGSTMSTAGYVVRHPAGL